MQPLRRSKKATNSASFEQAKPADPEKTPSTWPLASLRTPPQPAGLGLP